MQQPLTCIFQTLIQHEVLVIDQHWTQARVHVSVATCHGYAKNSWKSIAFNYITINFRNMYCRYIVLHFVSFDLM
jgi:hypothetical protein